MPSAEYSIIIKIQCLRTYLLRSPIHLSRNNSHDSAIRYYVKRFPSSEIPSKLSYLKQC